MNRFPQKSNNYQNFYSGEVTGTIHINNPLALTNPTPQPAPSSYVSTTHLYILLQQDGGGKFLSPPAGAPPPSEGRVSPIAETRARTYQMGSSARSNPNENITNINNSSSNDKNSNTWVSAKAALPERCGGSSNGNSLSSKLVGVDTGSGDIEKQVTRHHIIVRLVMNSLLLLIYIYY